MLGIIRRIFLFVVFLFCFAMSDVMSVELVNPQRSTLSQPAIVEAFKEFFGPASNYDDWLFISLYADSNTTIKDAYISLSHHKAVIKAFPKGIENDMYDRLDDCLYRHLKAVKKNKWNELCVKTINLDGELEKMLVSFLESDNMGTKWNGFDIHFFKNDTLYSVYVGKFDNPNSPGFGFYNRLYDLISEHLLVPMESCHWTKLIRNANGFFKYTDNPQYFEDLHNTCPEI